jgi:GTP:adenosylcobinamide-phosphate guanylyltransferase
MIALVTAGGTPKPGEPLYPYSQGRPKALIDVAGKPMIQWVLDALERAEKIDRIVVVGLSEEDGLESSKVSAYEPGHGSMLKNLRAGLEAVARVDPQAEHVATVSSDIPAINGEMVDWIVDAVSQSDKDIYYSVITREVMEKRFPTSNRSFTRLKDIQVCGGDLNAVRVRMARDSDELWDRILSARKNVFKQAALIGYDTLILLLLRQISLDRALQVVTRRLNVTGQAIVCPYAEIGMDIDKPHQLEILRTDLSQSKVAE